MREKELRLALICYGGVSLAVYMHGITKEIWHLARASRAYHACEPAEPGSETVYRGLLERIAHQCGIELRVLADILAGASAGGINAIFLAEAIVSGKSLEPLTELWLDVADVDKLLDPGVGALSRMAKAAAVPIAWALSARSGAVDRNVEPEHREEVRAKLANFVRARWFAPPFGGAEFTGLLLDAFEAVGASAAGPALLPHYQPLDLFVTVTDFHGHPERLRLNSPPEVIETEHRLTLAFRHLGGDGGERLADPAELAFAARATASFPGAFPPFRVGELDAVLEKRGEVWPGRDAFLAEILPHHAAAGDAGSAVLIDGSILANAPFRPAIDALHSRPARREVDRRFVYLDPKPGIRGIRLAGGGEEEPPGFFATIFGAMSDIPREQPIRDNLEAIEGRSARIRRLRRILEAMRPEVEAAIERTFGTTLLLLRPTARRLAGWRARAQGVAAREAGYAYAGYGHLKLSTVVEEAATAIVRLGGTDRQRHEAVRQAVWSAVRASGLTQPSALGSGGARPDAIAFFQDHDVAFRTRRLRFLARELNEIDAHADAPRTATEHMREAVYDLLGRYRAAGASGDAAEFAGAESDPSAALAALARLLDLRGLDAEADERLAAALNGLPKAERRSLILLYLGFPFYDVATLPLLQGEGLDEFDPVKVDRISPDDAVAIRAGGAAATLKGIQFNSFGAFFSRAYRENDYLWGRLHGADRLVDIVVSTLPEETTLAAETVAGLKRDAFRAILAEEKERLKAIPQLFEQLAREIG